MIEAMRDKWLNPPAEQEHHLHCPARLDDAETCACHELDREDAEASYEMRHDR